MSKIIARIELEGKIIFSKPLILENDLLSIREKINPRINCSYLFLNKNGKEIVQSQEKDYKLKDIIFGNIIKVNKNNINIVLNDTIVCSINIDKNKNLIEARKLINQNIKEDYFFLDINEDFIEKIDEKEFVIELILNNGIIKIKKNDSKITDFSKYDIIETIEGLTIYQYSKVEAKSNYKLVFQHFYEQYDISDFDNAYVILFCGLKGVGKTTAVNAFFNIIKGIELQDNYRFILINEKNDKREYEPGTYGIHLYYVKDYNNKPVILIDSQGYESRCRCSISHDLIDEALDFIFTNVINHINAIVFPLKANAYRFPIYIKYIFSKLSCLFSKEIIQNILFLATFANKDTMREGPNFIEYMKNDVDFLKIEDRMDEKWWYALDSKCILEDNEENRLNKYFFSQMNELYVKNIKKLKPKEIKNYGEILKRKRELKAQIELLNDIYKNIIINQENLREKEKTINEILMELSEMEKIFKCFEEMSNSISSNELAQKIKEINEKINEKIINIEKKEEKEIYLEELNKRSVRKNELDKQINELKFNKQKLIKEQNQNIFEKNRLEKKENNNNHIKDIIIKIKNISDKIKNISMNIL